MGSVLGAKARWADVEEDGWEQLVVADGAAVQLVAERSAAEQPIAAALAAWYVFNPGMVLTSRTVQRLLLVAVMTAAKCYDDVYYLNSRWCV